MKLIFITWMCCFPLFLQALELPIGRLGSFSEGETFHVGTPRLEGKAVLLKEKERVRLQLKAFPAQAGTLSFWVAPQAWNGLDGRFHILFTIHYTQQKQKRKSQIYKYANPDAFSTGLGLPFYDNIEGEKPAHPGAVWINYPQNRIGNAWKENSWHMIALAWKKQGDKIRLNYYVDDELAGTGIKQTPFAQAAEIVLGPEWGDPACTAYQRLELHEGFLDLAQIVEKYESMMESMAEEVEP